MNIESIYNQLLYRKYLTDIHSLNKRINKRLELLKLGYKPIDIETEIYGNLVCFTDRQGFPNITLHYYYLLCLLKKDKHAKQGLLNQYPNLKSIIKYRNKLINSGLTCFEIENIINKKYNINCHIKDWPHFIENHYSVLKHYLLLNKRGRPKIENDVISVDKEKKHKVEMKERMQRKYKMIKNISNNLLTKYQYNLIKKCLQNEKQKDIIIDKLSHFVFSSK